MTDIRLREIIRPVPVEVMFDWALLPSGGLDEAYELSSAVIVALGTDGVATPDDELPGLPPDDDRRGWWGDIDAEEIWGAWPVGSRLWLLERSKITDAAYRAGATVARAELYTKEALQPLIDQRICSRIDVDASRNTQNYSRIDVNVVVYRGPLPSIALLFDSLWEEQISGQQGSIPPIEPLLQVIPRLDVFGTALQIDAYTLTATAILNNPTAGSLSLDIGTPFAQVNSQIIPLVATTITATGGIPVFGFQFVPIEIDLTLSIGTPGVAQEVLSVPTAGAIILAGTTPTRVTSASLIPTTRTLTLSRGTPTRTP